MCTYTRHLKCRVRQIFVPEEVHPQLPSSDATMHERPTSKVGMYTRFFDYANYQMDLNAFIHTADPRKVKIVERARVENEIPIVTMAKHRTVTLLPTSCARTSEVIRPVWKGVCWRMPSTGDGADQGVDSVVGGDYAGTSVPVPEPVVADIPRPKRSKKKRVVYDSEGLPVASHPPKKLRADYGDIGGSATGGKSLSALNRLAETSRLSGPSVRFVVLSDSSHHSGTNSAGPEVDSSLLVIDVPLMSEATTFKCVTTRNLSLSSEVRMRAEYNILEKRKWKSLAEERNVLLEAKDREIEDLKSQLLKAKEIRGVNSTPCSGFLGGGPLESIIAGKDQELSDLGASSSSLRSENQRWELKLGRQALSVALNVCRGRVEKMERNLIERLPFLKDVFASIEDPLSAEALIEPSAEVPATNVLSTVVIAPPPDPSISAKQYTTLTQQYCEIRRTQLVGVNVKN
ncbi:hypothetical protein Tco_0714434 [Tanacetum coccineum]